MVYEENNEWCMKKKKEEVNRVSFGISIKVLVVEEVYVVKKKISFSFCGSTT